MEFKFPIPPGYTTLPVWTGSGFQIGPEHVAILKYTQCDAGWDANLTEFHEVAAEAGNHYIDRASRLHARHELQKIIKNKKNCEILEIGSSSGYLLQEIKDSFPESFLIGSDCISEPLEKISQKIPGIPLLQFDIVNCPLPDNCVDVVVALNVLEHIEDDQTALKQFFRILKPGGYAIIEVPAHQELYDFYDEQLKHFRRYSIHNLCSLATQAKFTIVRASHLGFFMYPGFRYLKLKNMQGTKRTSSQRRSDMKNLIQFGGPVVNGLLFLLMRMELFMGKFIQYPTGIRCLILLKKEIE